MTLRWARASPSAAAAGYGSKASTRRCPPSRSCGEQVDRDDRFNGKDVARGPARLSRSLVHHLLVSGLGWIADAPLVPLAYRLFRLIGIRSTMSSAGASGCQGARTVDRAE